MIILLVCSAFIAFFALIDLWYFWLLPFFFLMFFFSQWFSSMRTEISHSFMTQRYGLYLLSLLVFFGLFGILTFIGMAPASALWVLMLVSGGLWAASYFLPYEDGKFLFRYAFLLLGILLLVNQVIIAWGEYLLPLIGQVLAVWLLGFGLMYYGLRQWISVNHEYYYGFWFLVLMMLMYLVLHLDSDFLLTLNVNLLFYLGILSVLVYAYQRKLTPFIKKREISLRRVLAWERILAPEKPDPLQFLKKFLEKIKVLPVFLQYLLEYLNVVLFLGVLVSFLWHVFQWLPVHQFWYWLGISLFVVNAFLLKKMEIFTLVSRFAVALIVNFSLYISLIMAGDGLQEMLPWLISWNILCWIMLFYATMPSLKKYLKKSDLVFWLLTSLVAMLLNIVLLLKLEISGQLVFSLIFFYVGIQGIISYYAILVIKGFDRESKEGQRQGNLDALLEQEMAPFL